MGTVCIIFIQLTFNSEWNKKRFSRTVCIYEAKGRFCHAHFMNDTLLRIHLTLKNVCQILWPKILKCHNLVNIYHIFLKTHRYLYTSSQDIHVKDALLMLEKLSLKLGLTWYLQIPKYEKARHLTFFVEFYSQKIFKIGV